MYDKRTKNGRNAAVVGGNNIFTGYRMYAIQNYLPVLHGSR
jgi:hypothetical protein